MEDLGVIDTEQFIPTLLKEPFDYTDVDLHEFNMRAAMQDFRVDMQEFHLGMKELRENQKETVTYITAYLPF